MMIRGKTRGNLPGSDCGRVCQGGAEVSSLSRWFPWVNPRRSLQVGAENVLSLREDDHLSLLSSELKRLNIGIAALSEVRRLDCGEIMVGGAFKTTIHDVAIGCLGTHRRVKKNSLKGH